MALSERIAALPEGRRARVEARAAAIAWRPFSPKR